MEPKPQDNFEAEFEEAVRPVIDDLMKQNFASPPPGLLIPEKVWRENVRKELTDACTGKEIRIRLDSAQNVILEDLKSHLSKVEFEKFQENWKQGLDKILSDTLQPQAAGTLPPTLQSLMGITEETLSKLYDVGVRCYKSKDFVKAADVFFFITLIDYLRHNVWISLGLSEQQNLHWDLALAAFGMAVMTNADDPVSYLQSAECSLALQNSVEAKQYLDLAEASIKKAPENSRKVFLDQLGTLRQKF